MVIRGKTPVVFFVVKGACSGDPPKDPLRFLNFYTDLKKLLTLELFLF